MDGQRAAFETFIRDKYVDNPELKKSKTLTKEKLNKIVNVLKKDSCIKDYCPKFKHWIKQRGFSLMNYKVLGLQDVLCLPAKKKVGASLNKLNI